MGSEGTAMIFYHAGIVHKKDIFQLKKLIFRASRGKVLLKICSDDAIRYHSAHSFHAQNGKAEKDDSHAPDFSVYVLLFQDSSVLRQRVIRICESFTLDNKKYTLPRDGQGSPDEFRDALTKLSKDID
mmetsp:Transcript_25716/g.39545  ORF Transcript_25716/g.39545 Transcript_25716/m.39545 type:complete len:128 (+) Transcript_25716:750-1133(+)